MNNNALNKIIWINVLVFLLLNICFKFKYIDPKTAENLLALPLKFDIVLQKPWTLLTQMFTHLDIRHILGNMLLLYIFGKIFLKYLGSKKLISTYLLGGLFACFFLMIFDDLGVILGSSGATYAIILSVTAFVPNYSFKVYKTSLLVKLKYITIVLILVFNIIPIIIGLSNNHVIHINIGSYIAHIGGGIYGLLYIYLLKVNINIGFMIEKVFEFISSLFRIKNKKVTRIKNENDYDYNTRKKNEEQKLNKILEKVSKSGYSSLSKQEKEMLKKYN